MKAAYIERVGAPDQIRYGELPVPKMGPADVRVRVDAVTVDPIDVYIRSGQFSIPLPFPFIVGRDMVGRVAELGPAVTRFRPGDRVWCHNQGYDGRQGTFAEYIVTQETLLYALPAGIDAQEAVAFVHSGSTACVGLQRARPVEGETIFVNGGSGGVGSAVIQLAKARGLRIFATAGSADGLEWCRSLGAEAVANYRTDDVAQALAGFAREGVNIYWDMSGKPDFDAAVASIARDGRLILMSGLTARPAFPVGPFYVKGCTMHGFAVTHATPAELDASAAEINGWFSAGRLRVRIDRVVPLSAAAEAHRLVEEKTPLSGKIVLTP
ncbi:MAG TPA: NADPH:quinone reductase [Pirellulales bacterium]|nr:NADPH:quinone reductase [Pirellulales bacterium]